MERLQVRTERAAGNAGDLVPTPPRYFALPRVVTWLPVAGLRPHTSQDCAILKSPSGFFALSFIEPIFYCQFWSHCKGAKVTIKRMRVIAAVPLFFCCLVFISWARGTVPVRILPRETSPKATIPRPPKVPATRPPSRMRPQNTEVTGRRKNGLGATSIAIISQPSGLKTLTIHFPWSLFPDSSVEVRLVPGIQTKGTQVAPVYFHEQLKGKVRDDFYDCLDSTDNGGKSHSFTKNKVVYTMIGRLNSLGNQGVHVQVARESPKKSDYPSAAYLQLDTWAVDKKNALARSCPR